VEIEDQQYPCSNRDQLSARLIQAVLIPNYPPSAGRKAGHYCIMFIVLCGGVSAQDGKAGYEHGTKNYFSKIFYFPADFRISKTFSLYRSKCS
jgi:hypothetical protein